MPECASCGGNLANDLAECPRCNAETSRETFLAPRRQKRTIAQVKIAVGALFIGGGVVLAIAKRLPEFKEAFGPAILYVAIGVAVVVLLIRLFASSGEERL